MLVERVKFHHQSRKFNLLKAQISSLKCDFFFDFHGISDFRITPDPNYYNSSLMIVPVNTFQMARSNDDSVHLHGVHLSVN